MFQILTLLVVAVIVVAVAAGIIGFFVVRRNNAGPIAVAAVSNPDKTAGIVSVLDGAGIKCEVCQDPASEMWQVTVDKATETKARETLRGHAIGL